MREDGQAELPRLVGDGGEDSVVELGTDEAVVDELETVDVAFRVLAHLRARRRRCADLARDGVLAPAVVLADGVHRVAVRGRDA